MCFFFTILVSAVPILVLIVPIFFTNPHNYENKFLSTGHLTISNMSYLIPQCSNQQKKIFWALKNFKKRKSFLWFEPMLKWFLGQIKFCNLSPPSPEFFFCSHILDSLNPFNDTEVLLFGYELLNCHWLDSDYPV